ncbi:unnamed protein product [Phytomonas sp. Hart1]|nr:unnamed protein product [Phytomonas sp. Hart1]|eukprot:CCW67154.1 unnamed protein product [Phytomonas sp. isolate Hart1]
MAGPAPQRERHERLDAIGEMRAPGEGVGDERQQLPRQRLPRLRQRAAGEQPLQALQKRPVQPALELGAELRANPRDRRKARGVLSQRPHQLLHPHEVPCLTNQLAEALPLPSGPDRRRGRVDRAGRVVQNPQRGPPTPANLQPRAAQK